MAQEYLARWLGEEAMSFTDRERAQNLLNEFVGKTLSGIESDEHQLRLIFEEGIQFVTHSPWRLLRRDALLMGGGDVGGQSTISEKILRSLYRLKLSSCSVSSTGDTRLLLESDYVIEVISDSVQFETWEAHIEAGWTVFAGGSITVFPPKA
jgi:hypothetical protein